MTAAARMRGISASLPAKSQDEGNQRFLAGKEPGSGAVDAAARTDDEDADDAGEQHAGHAHAGHEVEFFGDDEGTDSVHQRKGQGDYQGPDGADVPEAFSGRSFQRVGGTCAAIVQDQHRQKDVDEDAEERGTGAGLRFIHELNDVSS